jgi:hypothetical protein
MTNKSTRDNACQFENLHKKSIKKPNKKIEHDH